jgi:ferredoxin
LRYLVPLAVAAGLLFSFSPLIMMFDPLSNFGRAMMALRSITLGSAAGFGFVLATLFVLILVTAFFRGRTFCSWCPVGVALGAVSRFSVFAPRIKPDCVSCGICEKKCPASCIDAGQKYIETERCVLCFSCTAGCPQTQVEYGLRFSGKLKKAADGGGDGGGNPRRREFLKQSATFACGVAYIMMPSLKMLFRRAVVGARAHAGGSAASAVTAVSTVTDATLPVLPPGASHFGHYKARCIGCQACAASCPVGIISPGNSPHPVLHYISSGCQFTCTECGKVCPTGAINRLSPEEKQRTRIALSSLQFETCIVKTKHEACGACAEVCPTGAITMTPYNEPEIPYLTRPALDEQYCIGCGACLVACPASLRDMPNPALTITAVTRQTLTAGVRPASEAGNELNVFTAEEFPF